MQREIKTAKKIFGLIIWILNIQIKWTGSDCGFHFHLAFCVSLFSHPIVKVSRFKGWRHDLFSLLLLALYFQCSVNIHLSWDAFFPPVKHCRKQLLCVDIALIIALRAWVEARKSDRNARREWDWFSPERNVGKKWWILMVSWYSWCTKRRQDNCTSTCCPALRWKLLNILIICSTTLLTKFFFGINKTFCVLWTSWSVEAGMAQFPAARTGWTA